MVVKNSNHFICTGFVLKLKTMMFAYIFLIFNLLNNNVKIVVIFVLFIPLSLLRNRKFTSPFCGILSSFSVLELPYTIIRRFPTDDD